MNKNCGLCCLVLAVTSCGSGRHLQNAESAHVEVRTKVETVHDTAFVELPVIIEKIATLDTTSTLENAYAKSEAMVAGGILHHSLESKPVKLPVRVVHQIVYRDSLVYRDRTVTETVEVERKLSRWQKTRMDIGTASLVLLVIAILYLLLKSINFLNPKRL